MEKLHESMGISKHLRAMRHLGIRLRSREATGELAEDVLRQRKALEAAHDAWQEAREARICATSELYYLDELLDRETSRLARETALITDGDTRHPVYKSMFPAAPSTLVAEKGGPNQRQFVTTVIDSLRREPLLAPLAHRADGLQTRLDALDRAQAGRDELYVPENQARNKLDIELDNTRRVYTTAYHRLSILYPEDPTLVESYFLSLTNSEPTTTAGAAGTGAETASDGIG